LLASRPIHKLENHPILAVRDYLFSILTATFHMWEPSPALWERTTLWWKGSEFYLPGGLPYESSRDRACTI